MPTDYLCRPDELPSGNNPDSEDEGEVGVAPAELAAATAKGTFRAANGAELSVREGETVAVMGRVRRREMRRVTAVLSPYLTQDAHPRLLCCAGRGWLDAVRGAGHAGPGTHLLP